MSKTDLEDDLRATLDRAAASVPLAPDLAERAATGAHRARRRTFAVCGAAVAGVAVIAAAGFALRDGGPTPLPPSAAGPTVAAGTPTTGPSVQQVTGTWRATKLDGFTALKTNRPENPVLTFNPNGTWVGSDGCNGISGTFSIGQRGEFTAKVDGQRLIECANVPHTAALQVTKRVEVDAKTLRLYAADGREVANYARTG
ncbi:heat shock protein HslJ [Kribbella amoyensis]|uniref:Heat shock protein HslJ n=1 Tax=Kribbella amoyensis TaxID=996641 RepID=A0A561BJU0_9ACTN|nr:META domain-containing protein [Kribbella amoyensis]TWD79100.1 heat shock protein HslJ [Kribbella amoyensis]